MTLMERCERFMKELGVPVTVFARKVRLTPQSIYGWRRGDFKLSEMTLKRIEDFLTKYNF